eukprot:5194346-Pleurochrysis_carterae.AAC.1
MRSNYQKTSTVLVERVIKCALDAITLCGNSSVKQATFRDTCTWDPKRRTQQQEWVVDATGNDLLSLFGIKAVDLTQCIGNDIQAMHD